MPEVHPHALAVPAWSRAAIKHQRPRCVWLTGLSGADKSTLANRLEVATRELLGFVLSS